MALRRQPMYTSMIDLDEYQNIDWVFVRNVKTQLEYDGIIHSFRREGIPWALEEKGTLRQNHFFLGLFVHPSRDINYGMDVYVPEEKIRKAKRILADETRLSKASAQEAVERERHQEEFVSQVVEHKQRLLAEDGAEKQRRTQARKSGIRMEKQKKSEPTGSIRKATAVIAEEKQANKKATTEEDERRLERQRNLAKVIKVVIVVLVILTTLSWLYIYFGQ